MSFFSSPFFAPVPFHPHHHAPRFPSLYDDEFFADVPRSLGHHLLRDPMSHRENAFDEMHAREMKMLNDFFKKNADDTMDEDKSNDGNSPSQVEYKTVKSTIVDKDGKTVKQTQRYYKDSTGRWKSRTDREVDGVKRSTQWERLTKDGEVVKKDLDQLKDQEVSDFEKQWSETCFGKDKLMLE